MTDFYLVGGGRSLYGFDWRRLQSKRVIAINRAFEVLPNAEAIYFSDLRVWKWYEKALLAHRGAKVTGAKHLHHDDVKYLKLTGPTGLDLNPRHLRHGNNSGYAAINLAVHHGAKRIFLLGYDMQFLNNKQHWHDGYPVVNQEKIFLKMVEYFDTLVGPLEQLGVEVFNLSDRSRLETFPKITIEEAGL